MDKTLSDKNEPNSTLRVLAKINDERINMDGEDAHVAFCCFEPTWL